MQIVKPYVKLICLNGQVPTTQAGIDALKAIEWAGRISHRSEEQQTQDSYDRFIRAVVIGHGDWSD